MSPNEMEERGEVKARGGGEMGRRKRRKTQRGGRERAGRGTRVIQ